MSVSDDLLQPTSDSFWEVGQYKRTVKRHEDGQKLCADLMLLIQERADIEKHYAKSLRAWSKKWNDLIDKGPEYGTTQGAWKGVLAESDSIAEIHLTIKENLLHEVQANIKQWKNDNYHKSMVGLCKESKELEEGFKKAQKPWAKKLAKVIDCKKKHHLACKSEKSATNQENNARADSSMSPDALKKLQDKVEKCRREVEHTRDKYETALSDLNSYNAKYMEEMREVFLKSQEYEEKRLKFFKDMLYGVHKCLDISENVQMKQIYQQLEHTIDQADYSKDLRWWSQNHGEEMAMHWPVFEEYSPELNTISRKEKKSGISGDGITLTSIQNKETYRGDLSKPVTVQNTYSNEPSPPTSTTAPAANAAAVAPVRPPPPGTPKPSPAPSPRKSSASTPKVPPPPVPNQSEKKTPQQLQVPRQESYDPNLNPFAADDDVYDEPKNDENDDDEDDMDALVANNMDPDDVHHTHVTNNRSPVKPCSLNPFGDDDDDDDDNVGDKDNTSLVCDNKSASDSVSEGNTTGSKKSLNPFGDDFDDTDDEGEIQEHTLTNGAEEKH